MKQLPENDLTSIGGRGDWNIVDWFKHLNPATWFGEGIQAAIDQKQDPDTVPDGCHDGICISSSQHSR